MSVTIKNANLNFEDYVAAMMDKGLTMEESKEMLKSRPAIRLMKLQYSPEVWVIKEFVEEFGCNINFKTAPGSSCHRYTRFPTLHPKLLASTPGYRKGSQGYVADPDLLLEQVLAYEAGDNQLLVGPTGCGKTFGAEEFMLRLGIPVFTIPCTGETDYASLMGQTGIQNGDTAFDPGPVTLALQAHACIILDEVTAIDPSRGLDMNPLLEGRDLVIAARKSEDMVIHNHGLSHVIGTSNTGGKRNGNRAYKNAHVQDLAWRDRWVMTQCDYSDISIEREKALKIFDEMGLPVDQIECHHEIEVVNSAIDGIMNVLKETRKSFVDEHIQVPLSNRGMKSWIKRWLLTNDIKKSFESCVLTRVEEDDVLEYTNRFDIEFGVA